MKIAILDSDILAVDSGGEEFPEAFQHEIDHLIGQPGVDADEECVPHDPVRLLKGPGLAHADVPVSRLLEDVAAEDLARLDIGVLQPPDKLSA